MLSLLVLRLLLYLEFWIGDEFCHSKCNVDTNKNRRVEWRDGWRQRRHRLLVPEPDIEDHAKVFPTVHKGCKKLKNVICM